MQFIALVSGGKDSIYNMQMAMQDGHIPVCLLNMKMPAERDSFMFQYAGNNLLPGISECLNLPLHQKETSGLSKERGIEYKVTENDEIEDLFSAIRSLQGLYEFSAVSVGAISSVYQYNRVKSVCDRLNLQVLAYLWGQDQRELLQRMCRDGICAIVVKGGGYVGELLGETISTVYTKYSGYIQGQLEEHKSLTEKDFNLCGEGGEYETLTLDAPIYAKRIEIVRSTVEEEECDVKTLCILEYKVVDKAQEKPL
ncbi:diphthine-ammonia ligase [Nematocida major]|uniref:diphthine-ammonia ligase n=1 Tax=Nematocida major TaxID=1912982 RepID=UPI0020082EBC|nr:diphthine-ammonia ligase [Nematocida major]KAH9386996.1 diphthine-ammonia ligase [Nematocida major]